MSTPCYICESGIDEIRVGPDLKPLPCSTCLGIIHETVKEYDEDHREAQEEYQSHESLEDYLSHKRKYDV